MSRFLITCLFLSITTVGFAQKQRLEEVFPETQEVHMDDVMTPEEIQEEIEASEGIQFEAEEPLLPGEEFNFTHELNILNFDFLNRQQPRSPEWNALLPDESFRRHGIDWVREYDLIVVVNKAITGPTAQKAIAYYRGEYAGTFVVSTGREQNEKAKSGKRYFSSTPTGWFSPTVLSRNHVSSLWGAKMPFAVFFNGGIATHAALPAYYKDLGTRASGGCVRLHTSEAQWIFDRVQSSGKGMVPQFNRNGEPVLDKNGQVKYTQNWRTIIIVVNREGR
jgi:lipoprotein-anchoring transpeptidase ErfK/SrfK